MSSSVTMRGPAWIVSPMRSLAQRLGERVGVAEVARRALDPAAGGGLEHARAGLDGGALHVVEDAAHAAHLLAAARPAGAAVHQHRQRGAVAGGLGGGVVVEDEEAAVPGGGAEDHLAGEVRVLGDDRAGQAALAEGGQLDDVLRAGVADQRADRAERLDLVQLGAAGVVLRLEQDRGDERAAFGVGAGHVDPGRDDRRRSWRRLRVPSASGGPLRAGRGWRGRPSWSPCRPGCR